MPRLLLILTTIFSATVVLPAWAEKVDMSPAALTNVATHVLTGQVKAVYQQIEEDGDWKHVSYLAEVHVGDCEKGEGIKKGDLVYVRYWRRSFIGKGLPPFDTSGHRGLPTKQQYVRVYLSRNAYDGFGHNKDGGFNVIGANGFEILKAASSK